MTDNIIVTVVCTTYNHEKFIRDAMEGILKQKTNFRYELIIHDDASTDGTPDIIREYSEKYPEIIRPILQKENQRQKGNNKWRLFILPRVRGKYIAICEGDDYWTDENKLQLQTDFMEAHSNYSMCMHNAVKLNYETGKEVWMNTFKEDGTYAQKDQLLAGLGSDFPAFASYFLRAELWKDMPEFFWTGETLDYPLRQYYASKGEIYYFQKPMSVYRIFTPASYMKGIRENKKKYHNYVLAMITFYEKLDRYLENKFHDILGCKILSEYWGLALSADEAEAERKACETGLNLNLLRECYRRLSEDYSDQYVRRLSENSEHLFIYGASRLALICQRQLERQGIEFDGFVVSDGQIKNDELNDKKIFYLSEVDKNYSNPGFILALQPINAAAVLKSLEGYGLKRYYEPYKIV